MSWVQKVRASLVIGATWAVAWGVATMVAIYAIVVATRSPAERADMATRMAIAHSIPVTAFVLGAMCGFTAGALFSMFLAVVESRVGSRRMAGWRVLTWGSVAGLFARLASPLERDQLAAPYHALAAGRHASTRS
jgi:hypothetical protein